VTEILIAGAVVCIVVLIVVTMYAIEKARGCWHNWGHWQDESTDIAYAQYRVCTKCGYIEREQFKKIKGKAE